MRVLFVQDKANPAGPTLRALTQAGVLVDRFGTIEDGWHAWRVAPYDVVILDIMPGRDDGLAGLAGARAAGHSTPVLLLAAQGSVSERVRGLDAGADDYMTAPFASEELVARVRALARRPRPLAAPVIRHGDVAYHVASRELAVGEARASLSRGESIVLEHFLRAPGRVITKAQLGERLHSMEQDYTDNSIQVHVHRVRRKLADLGACVSIRALRGLGYMAQIHARPELTPT